MVKIFLAVVALVLGYLSFHNFNVETGMTASRLFFLGTAIVLVAVINEDWDVMLINWFRSARLPSEPDTQKVLVIKIVK